MTLNQLIQKIENKSNQENVDIQDLYQMYFFERLLYRISISKYRHNFILKGGLLLSALFAEEKRTTHDMDTMIKGLMLQYDTLKAIFQEISSVECEDGIRYEVVNYKETRLNDRYGALKLYLFAYKEELKLELNIDVTVGDPITPKEVDYQYPCMFEDTFIHIMTFNKETVIAEKFEVLISNSLENTNRIKDFYDLYLLITHYYDDLNKLDLYYAIRNTFYRRGSNFDLNYIKERFELISSNETLQAAFCEYMLSKPFVTIVNYSDVISTIRILINTLQNIMDESPNDKQHMSLALNKNYD